MFKKLLTPKQLEEYESFVRRRQERTTKLKALEDQDLADKLEYCIVNCGKLLREHRNKLTTYEDALLNVYLPEILRRLRGDEKPKFQFDSYGELRNKIIAQEE